MNKFIGSKEACEFFGIKLPTLNKWCCEGRVPFYKVGGKRMFDIAELEATVRESLDKRFGVMD